MSEWKRTVLNKRFLGLLLGVIILNGVFFLKAQFDRDLGLDLSEPESQLPNSIVVSEEGIPTSEQPPQISIKALYQEYLGLLSQMKQRSPDEITAELTEQMKQLSTLWDGCVLHERKENSEFDGVQWQNFVQQQPKAADEIINNTITKETVYSKYVAVHTLLQRAEVLASFPERLLAIEKNKETMENFPLFQDKTSFSYQNILKTANEFRRLQGVPLSLENSGMIEGILTFGGSDFLLLILLAAGVFSFLAERKRGLWGLIHSFPQGRDTLALHRLGILFCISFVGTLLLYGSNILIGTILYGGIGTLNISVQSIPMLQEFPVLVSQGGFLIRYCSFRIISAFLLGLILWLLTGAVSDVRCGVMLGIAIVLIEYGLYRFLPVQSAYNILKYLNICTYFHIAPLYTHYLNVDIWGVPMGIRRVSEVAALPLTLIASGGCIAGQCFRRPTSGKNWGEMIFEKMRKWTDCYLRRLPLCGREVYKILFSQRGILIFLLFIYLALGIEHSVPIRATNEQKAYEWQYLAQLQGTITQETFSEIADLQNEQEESIKAAEQAKEAYEAGKISRGELIPSAYYESIGRCHARKVSATSCNWNQKTIVGILENRQYTGCSVNFKSTTVSYKVHRRVAHPKEEYQIIPNKQEPIISEEEWLRVQELREHRCRPTATGRQSLFSGLVYCPDCGAKLYFCAAKSLKPNQEFYCCSNYKSGRGSCTVHYIRNVVLENLVLEAISDLADFVRCYEPVFLYMLAKKNNALKKAELQKLKHTVEKGQQRIVELDRLIEKIYEDNALGRLSDERYTRMMASYEKEQKTLIEEVEQSQKTLEESEQQTVDLRLMLRTLRELTDVKELTPTLVNSLIQRIEVHNNDKSSGHCYVKVDIYFTAVGMIDIPTEKEIQAMIREIQENPQDCQFIA